MEFVIVTGISGAGKSRAIECLEDIGFYCVDNIPPALIPKFAEICFQSKGKLEKVAMVVDIRGGALFSKLFGALSDLEQDGYEYKILFLEAKEKTLITRYKETRRKHPLAMEGERSVSDAITEEIKLLAPVRERADYIIDTSGLSVSQLRENIIKIFVEKSQENRVLIVTVQSFGFKYGIPADADLVFDVRFLPNPFYIKELSKKTGLSKEVRDYVLKYDTTTEFKKKLFDLLSFLLPNYIEEGKSGLVIGVGCTGGKHRSVVLAEETAAYLKESGYYVVCSHRDIEKDAKK